MEKQKKVALITGARGNLGSAVWETFKKYEYQVVGTRHQPDYEYAAATEGDQVGIDLLSAADCSRMISDIRSRHGRTDIAVLTVGGFDMGDLATTDEAALLHQYRLNFETAYMVARPLIQQMEQQRHGRLFFIGALPALFPERAGKMIAYSLSKSLLFQLAEIINATAEKTGVAACVVVPSVIDTPENRKAMPDADPGQWESPRQLAELIAVHANDAVVDFPEVLKITDV